MRRIKDFAPFIPYIAVLIGIYLLHSVWIAAVVYHLAIGIVLWRDRDWLNVERRTLKNSRFLLPANFLIGAFTGALLYKLWPILGVPENLDAKLAHLGLTSWLIFGIYYCLVNPIAEELFWRRYLASPSSRLTWNDVLFGGYHVLVLAPFMRWPWLILSCVLLAFASWIWRRSARQQNGTQLIIASHFFADLGIILVGYLCA